MLKIANYSLVIPTELHAIKDGSGDQPSYWVAVAHVPTIGDRYYDFSIITNEADAERVASFSLGNVIVVAPEQQQQQQQPQMFSKTWITWPMLEYRAATVRRAFSTALMSTPTSKMTSVVANAFLLGANPPTGPVYIVTRQQHVFRGNDVSLPVHEDRVYMIRQQGVTDCVLNEQVDSVWNQDQMNPPMSGDPLFLPPGQTMMFNSVQAMSMGSRVPPPQRSFDDSNEALSAERATQRLLSGHASVSELKSLGLFIDKQGPEEQPEEGTAALNGGSCS